MIKLSVIIPTFNRAKLLEKTLDSLLSQTYEQNCFEIIVIDNASEDNTKDVAEKYRTSFKHFKYFYDDAPGLHIGRHLGLKESKGEILVYLDDDVRLFENHLEAVQKSFDDMVVGLVGGNNLPEYEVSPPPWVNQLWIKNKYGMYLGQYSLIDFGNKERYISSNFVFGCNFSIRKSVLKEIASFHPDGFPKHLVKYSGDGETFVANEVEKLGYKVLFNPTASVYHFVPKERLTYTYLQKQGYRIGIGTSYRDIRRKKKNTCRKIAKLFFSCVRSIFLKDKVTKIHKISVFRGYLFHQLEFFRNKQFRDWVLRENYIEKNGII